MSKHLSTGNFTRGGQMMTHQFRMFAQGMRASFFCGTGSALAWGLWRIPQHLSFHDLYHWGVATWVSLKLVLLDFFYGHTIFSTATITFYHSGFKKWVTIKAFAYVNWASVRYCITRAQRGLDWVFSIKFIEELFIAFCMGIGLSAIFFAYKGWKKHQRTFERGGHLLSASHLTQSLKRKGQNADITFDGLPLVKDAETLHILVSGTTGAGKTNALHKLLPQIRAKGQKAIIVDVNGTFVSRYYREGHDVLLNPFDPRTAPWSPWADCHTPSHYDAFAEAMVPSGSLQSDRFWEQAARTLLASALEELRDVRHTTELCHLLLGSDLKTLELFFKNTPAHYLMGEATDKMSLSVLATLSHPIKALTFVADTEVPFSIRQWMQNDGDAWLFLTAPPDQRATLKPLITTWLDIAFNGLMSLTTNRDKRVWFILDELPALHKIPSLPTALAESRKFGGCVVAGIQNIHQLQKIYGQAEAHALMDLFNTSFIFRTEDPDTCRYLSAKLGEQELQDIQENISYGANTMRDGVNLNAMRRQRTLVLPTEISLLPNLTCYVKYPGNWPVAKLKMTFEN